MKKLFSLLLVLVLCIGLLAVPAAADDFVIDANGVLTKYNGPGGDVVIPNGVTKIGTSAFYGCSTLTSVTIPEGVTSIGDQAFMFCHSLQSVTLPGSVTEIGNAVFLVCQSLHTITVSSGNTAFSSIDGVLFNKAATKLITCPGGKSGTYTIPGGVTSIDNNAFNGCYKLTSIAIPGSLNEIGYSTFTSCASLAAFTVASGNPSFAVIDGVLFNKALSILVAYPGGKSSADYSVPDSVTSIRTTAFDGCVNLTSVTIPSSVTEIGASAFLSCASLTAITVASGNSAFADVDGVLFNNAVTKLISYPCGRSGAYTVPDGVTSIEQAAFYYCKNLTGITIPSSVTTICQFAFLACFSLTDVTYLGTEAQWKAITIESGNEALENATIHYEGTAKTLEISGEVKASELPDVESLMLSGDTVLIMDTDKAITLLFAKTYQLDYTLTIKGEGKLSTAHIMVKELVLNSGLLRIHQDNPETSFGGTAMDILAKKVIVNGGTLDADHYNTTMEVDELSVTGGILRAASDFCAICADQMTVSGGEVYASGGLAGIAGRHSMPGGSVFPCVLSISGGLVEVKTPPPSEDGWTVGAALNGFTMTGGTFISNGSLTAVNSHAAITLGENMQIISPTGGSVSAEQIETEHGWNGYKILNADGTPATEVTITEKAEPIRVTPSVSSDDPWITAAAYAGDTLTLTAGDGVSAPVFLAAYDKDSGRMVGVFPATCKDGQYTLPVGVDADKYQWKLLFVDALSSAPLTCDYQVLFSA